MSFLDIARRFGTALDETEWDAYRDFGKGSGHPAGLNFGDCFPGTKHARKHDVDSMNNSKSGAGYKRPPVHMRFRPGRSGNPTGRPKRRLGFRAALLSELATTMPGKDQMRAGSKLEALVRMLVNSAIAGDGRAQALFVGALARIGDVEDNELNSLAPDDKEILDAYVGGELKRRANETDAPPSVGERNED